MVDKPHSQFHAGTPFTCTGKIAGLLNHSAMKRPPELERDYVFIVVPDTWTFLDKNAPVSSSVALPSKTPTKAAASAPLSLLQAAEGFTTTKVQMKTDSEALPTPDGSPTTARAGCNAGPKRPYHSPNGPQGSSSPSKKPRLSHSTLDPTLRSRTDSPSTAQNNSPTYVDSPSRDSDHSDTSIAPVSSSSTKSAPQTHKTTTDVPSEMTSRTLRRQSTRITQQGNLD